MSGKNYIYLTVWNMNGGPMSPALQEDIEKAVKSVLDEAEKKDGTRHLIALESKQEAA